MFLLNMLIPLREDILRVSLLKRTKILLYLIQTLTKSFINIYLGSAMVMVNLVKKYQIMSEIDFHSYSLKNIIIKNKYHLMIEYQRA